MALLAQGFDPSGYTPSYAVANAARHRRIIGLHYYRPLRHYTSLKSTYTAIFGP